MAVEREMEAPQVGLRRPGVRLLNKSNGPAKVAISVAPGAVLEVDDDVAGQLLRQAAAFSVVDQPQAPLPADDGGVEEAGGGAARRASGRRRGGD